MSFNKSVNIVFLLLFILTVYGDNCPSGWLQYNVQCFKLFSKLLDWHQARSACDDLDADLAVMKTKDVNNFVAQYVREANDVHWIGLHDITNEGRFTWIDDEGLLDETQSMWNFSQPDNYGATGEDCVEILVNGNWNDYPCEKYYKAYICEIDLDGGGDGENDMSAGAVVGTIIGVLIVIALIGVVTFFVVKRAPWKKTQANPDVGSTGFENAVYNASAGKVEVIENTSSEA